MLEEITKENLDTVQNPVFRDYARMYVDIYEGFIRQVEEFGLPFDREGARALQEETLREMKALKALPTVRSRCQSASFFYKQLSPACKVCKQGVGTLTSHISFRCHRQCFFCFNPNQANYESHLTRKNDWRRELDSYHQTGQPLTHIALTGGEPMLYPEESAAFFSYARRLFPKAHLRLYTCGDLLHAESLKSLRDAGLHEIRFSYKMEDTKEQQEAVLSLMSLAREYIPSVMVEMPVMPDREEEMKDLLLTLEEIGIWGINLLELCFPYHNPEAFLERGYRLKYPPYRTLYNFWYAGGLPVAGSELLSLKLLRFGAEQGLSYGIHTCSLENKNYGQMYQQNHHPSALDQTLLFSEKDYYLKTVKAFGEDALTVRQYFDKRKISRYRYHEQAGYIQFHPSDAARLQGRDLELALSVNVLENRDGTAFLRELKLLKASPSECAPRLL